MSHSEVQFYINGSGIQSFFSFVLSLFFFFLTLASSFFSLRPYPTTMHEAIPRSPMAKGGILGGYKVHFHVSLLLSQQS